MLPTTASARCRSIVNSTSSSFSRMASLVSWGVVAMISSLCIETPRPGLGAHRHVPRQSHPTSRHNELSWNSLCPRGATFAQLAPQRLRSIKHQNVGESGQLRLARPRVIDPGTLNSCASGHYSTTLLIHVAPAPNVDDQTETNKCRQY